MVRVVRGIGVVEDKGPVSMDGLCNTVPSTPGRGIVVATAVVAATARGWRFPGWLKSHSSGEDPAWRRNIHRRGAGVAVVAARPACWFFARLIWPVSTRQRYPKLEREQSGRSVAHRSASAGEGLACQEADLLHQLLVLVRHGEWGLRWSRSMGIIWR